MKEIEQKFLVRNDSFKRLATSSRHIEQAYLSVNPEATVRVRISDNSAFLTVKGITHGAVRDEWEYEIPVDDARQMMAIAACPPLIKTRWIVPYAGFTWEVDEFGGRLCGLTVAEVEKEDEATTPTLPDFVGREVTGDARYYNSYLSQCDVCPESE